MERLNFSSASNVLFKNGTGGPQAVKEDDCHLKVRVRSYRNLKLPELRC